jgi:two-component system chemotaxis response regulator CheB
MSTSVALHNTDSSWVPAEYPMGAVIVIAASAGGLEPLREIVKALRESCKTSTFVVVHIGPYQSNLPSPLTFSGGPPASFAQDSEFIEGGRIYVAPPDRHMTFDHGRIQLSSSPKVHYTRPAADPLFVSAAKHFGKRVVGIVLSGGNSDGAVGIKAIQDHGGTAFVQLPTEAKFSSMPLAAIAAARPDILPTTEIARRVGLICGPS